MLNVTLSSRAPGPALGWCLAAVIGLALTFAARAAEAGRSEWDAAAAGRIVFLLEYIGFDYENAVRNGRIIDPYEHRELTDFCREASEQYARTPNAAERTLTDLGRLAQIIRDRASEEVVHGLAYELASRIADDLGASPRFTAPVDVTRGRLLYHDSCAVCHGAAGGGDGPAAAGMDPPPTSFRDRRMGLVRPRQLQAAIAYGVDGTAMPFFSEAFTSEQIWDLAFYLMTLREDFDPRSSSVALPVSLEDLAVASNKELLGQLRRVRPETDASMVDHYRLDPPRPRLAQATVAKPPARPPSDGVPESGLEAAALLENAFGTVAQDVFPSVVGLSFYDREPARAPKGGSGWRESSSEAPTYPGYRLVRTGTGFFVDEGGYILSCHHLLIDPKTRKPAEIVDVETRDNRHERARVVGVEPTVDLLVLKIDSGGPWPSATMGGEDPPRVGQWAIALGDPPGVERVLVPGILSTLPERDCYQEKRTSTLLQTSLRLDPASFGGPLVDIHGKVIGISMPRTPFPETVDISRDRGYALPISLAMTLYQAIKVKESRRSPWLGFSVLDLSSSLRKTMKTTPLTGVYIDDVFDPSPASRAGIRVGDVLTAMDGNRILAVQDFQKWLYLSGIGKTVTLELSREGRVERKRVTIKERPETAAPR